MKTAVALALLTSLAHHAWGQAATATANQGVRLQSYALENYTQPGFGGATSAAGVTVGSNFNFFQIRRFQPSLDLRASSSFGPVRQNFLGGGPRLTVDLGRFHPYGEYLIGYGVMHFSSSVSSYTHDNSVVTSAGGGVDFSLNNRWAVRIDAQRQNWQFTPGSPSYHPLAIGVGLRYQFHFKSKNGPE